MKERGSRKKKIGTVVSVKMDKTVVVEIERRFIDPMYKKIVKRKKRYKAHDENNICKIGDKVVLMETRPLSKGKRWRVSAIMEKASSIKEKKAETLD